MIRVDGSDKHEILSSEHTRVACARSSLLDQSGYGLGQGWGVGACGRRGEGVVHALGLLGAELCARVAQPVPADWT